MSNFENVLESLLSSCKQVRDSAGYHRTQRQHLVSASQWRAFCIQIKATEHVLEKYKHD